MHSLNELLPSEMQIPVVEGSQPGCLLNGWSAATSDIRRSMEELESNHGMV